MAHRLNIRGYVLMYSCLLALPPGWAALTCCRRELSNGSTSCHLSHAPDPTCKTQWTAGGVTVVDESGQTYQTQVHHAGPQTLILKGHYTDVRFHMDCMAVKEALMLQCKDLCGSSDERTNAVIRSTSDGIFILLSIIIIIIITSVT